MKAEVGKRYRHYKNGKEYTVIAIGRLESNPSTECVVYRAEYDSPDFGKNPVWIRARTQFEEIIVIDGIEKQRFSEV